MSYYTLQMGKDRKGDFYAYRTTPIPTRKTISEMSNLSKKEVRKYLGDRYYGVTEIKFSEHFICRNKKDTPD